MKPGVVAKAKHLHTVQWDGKDWVETHWAPPKGEIFVIAILGTEGGEPLDPEKVLREWGWEKA